jgi:hypothetical protein
MRRGRNFLGAQSWLNDFYYIIAWGGDEICGAVPLASFSIRLPNDLNRLKILTFAGDYVLAPYQDFLALREKRRETISLLINKGIELMRTGHDLLFFGYIPEDSPSIQVLDETLKEMDREISWRKCITSQKGGVHPWTLTALQKLLFSLIQKIGRDKPEYIPLYELADRLGECRPETVLFPKTRMELETTLKDLISGYARIDGIKDEIQSFHCILSPSPIRYPFINLPQDRESYFQQLGKKTRFNFRYYRKKLLESGGTIEKINSENVEEDDIRDYLNLHMMRWGKQSVAISDSTFDFHVRLCSLAKQEGYLSLFFVRLNGRRIAAHACFDIHDRREAYFTGLDPDHEKSSAGIVLFHETILDAVDNHFSRYALGYGGDEYKFRFTNTAASSFSYFIAEKNTMPDLNKIFLGYECMVESISS